MSIPPVIRLLRPKQWTKGLLVFGALLFTQGHLDPDAVLRSVIAFVAIGLVSSSVYVLNDILDVERDRKHPMKRHRPLAAGKVTVPIAIGAGIVCFVAGILLANWLGSISLGIVGAYLLLQVAYNGYLKRQPVADVFTLATGFVLRTALGAAAIDVKLSGWILFCTGALALLLGFGKRRHEFVLQSEDRATSREALGGYTMAALDALVATSAASAAMCYGIYCIESPTARQFPAVIITAPFVFYGISRYVFLIFAQGEGGEPENILFRDPHLVWTVLLYVAAAVFALTVGHLPLVEA